MKVFISYSWDSESHQTWVVNLANKLRENGIDANVDVFHFQEETTNFNKMMIKNISESDFIIIVLTEEYKRKVDDWKDGVGFENELLLPILKVEIERNKLIFIMRHRGNYKEVFPFHFKDYYAIDFTEESKYSLKFKELLHRLYGEPLFPKTKLGKKPILNLIETESHASEMSVSEIKRSVLDLDIKVNIDNLIIVDSVNMLLKSIGSNRILHLRQGIYNLSKAFLAKNRNVEWLKVFDGKYPQIKGIENLTITAEVGTQILIEPRYAFVLAFENCNNIVLHNLTLGHTKSGYCLGGVLGFQNSNTIYIKDTVLFGCGTIGVELTRTSDFHFIESTIKECTYSIMHINDSDNTVFYKSFFKDNSEFDLIDISNSHKISFDECTIMNNRTGRFLYHLFKIDEKSSQVILSKSIVKYNEVEEFVNNKNRIQISDTEFKYNNFTER